MALALLKRVRQSAVSRCPGKLSSEEVRRKDFFV
jgi:hypothetical protein